MHMTTWNGVGQQLPEGSQGAVLGKGWPLSEDDDGVVLTEGGAARRLVRMVTGRWNSDGTVLD